MTDQQPAQPRLGAIDYARQAHAERQARAAQPGRPTASTITDTQLDQLWARAERAEALLHRYVQLADVTHAYPIQGGHDCLGANLTCAGCALRDEIRVALDEHQEQP